MLLKIDIACPIKVVLQTEYLLLNYPKHKKKVEENQGSQAKKKLPEKDAEKKVEKKDEELSVSLLKIQIGHIRKAWKHPSADR